MHHDVALPYHAQQGAEIQPVGGVLVVQEAHHLTQDEAHALSPALVHGAVVVVVAHGAGKDEVVEGQNQHDEQEKDTEGGQQQASEPRALRSASAAVADGDGAEAGRRRGLRMRPGLYGNEVTAAAAPEAEASHETLDTAHTKHPRLKRSDRY